MRPGRVWRRAVPAWSRSALQVQKEGGQHSVPGNATFMRGQPRVYSRSDSKGWSVGSAFRGIYAKRRTRTERERKKKKKEKEESTTIDGDTQEGAAGTEKTLCCMAGNGRVWEVRKGPAEWGRVDTLRETYAIDVGDSVALILVGAAFKHLDAHPVCKLGRAGRSFKVK